MSKNKEIIYKKQVSIFDKPHFIKYENKTYELYHNGLSWVIKEFGSLEEKNVVIATKNGKTIITVY